MDLFKNIFLLILTPECFDQYFVEFNFFHGECLKSTLSKLVGWVIIAGSVTVKVPQILKILNNKSGEGLSVIGTFLDFFAITSMLLYSYLSQFPFSSWGEGFFMSVQTAVIFVLILFYKNQHSHLILFLSAASITIFLLLSGVIPLSVLWTLQILNLPIIIMGKGAQALTNYKNKNTGQLSAATCWMQFGGSVARILTSMQDTGDALIIFTFLICGILNGIVLFQLIYYSKPSKTKSKKKSN